MPSLYKCYANGLCLLGWADSIIIYSTMQSQKAAYAHLKREQIGEDEENWDTISLSSFDPTLCITVMPFISLYVPIM